MVVVLLQSHIIFCHIQALQYDLTNKKYRLFIKNSNYTRISTMYTKYLFWWQNMFEMEFQKGKKYTSNRLILWAGPRKDPRVLFTHRIVPINIWNACFVIPFHNSIIIHSNIHTSVIYYNLLLLRMMCVSKISFFLIPQQDLDY